MGLKKMLEQGIANEAAQLNKASEPAEPIIREVSSIETEPKRKPVSEPSTQKRKTGKSDSKQTKNPGGRPTNKEKGIQSRKQYTLTLKEDTYNMILDEARKEELSFAKFMERAALEYIRNHK